MASYHPMTRLLVVCLLLSALGLSAEDLNWPEFRGPRGDGTSTAKSLPLRWSETEGVKWKVPIHGRGWSSPVIWGPQLWLTTATPDGHQRYVVCLDGESGRIQYDVKLFEVAHPQSIHTFNSYASPTPAIEAGRIYVSFGAAGTACLDTQTAKVLWTRTDLECNHFRGAGSSPILYGELLFLNFDGSDRQYVVALDKQTGQTVWRTDRSIDFQDLGPDGKPEAEGDLRKAFATCQVATFEARTILLSPGSRALYAYDPSNGKELWRVEERTSYSGCTRPVVGHGLVFVPSGFASGQVLAIRPGQPGEVLDAKADPPPATQLRVVWKARRNAPKKPSLLLSGDLLYGIEDNGVATCWEAMSGRILWSARLGGHFSASPIAAAGRIYCFSEEGKSTVFADAREFKTLAESELADGFMASPAISGHALFLRTRSAVYRIEDCRQGDRVLPNA